MHLHYSLAFSFAALELHVARFKNTYSSFGVAFVFIVVVLGYTLITPGSRFPLEQKIAIREGDSLYETALRLENQRYIYSAPLFMAMARVTAQDTHIQTGEYIFHAPKGMLGVLYNLSHGITGIEVVRVRLEEGTTARDMAGTLSRALPAFNRAQFEEIAIPLEGYLFPDTYFFPTDVTPEEVIERVYGNFNETMSRMDGEFEAFNRSLHDVTIMASLLEREGRSLKEKRILAGILWHRIAIDMPLQVDAVFGYINNRATYSPSFADLEVDSLYNTYKYKGLPPGPIANPGYESLLAAVTPSDTGALLYYLTGNDGLMHYAKTFNEHKSNRARFLD